ncbi:MAG: OmpA family protein [Deltaproteobacteria bacterium]|nr:MAG: OmpA family protein [Deltaproteobacteria bacterium]
MGRSRRRRRARQQGHVPGHPRPGGKRRLPVGRSRPRRRPRQGRRVPGRARPRRQQGVILKDSYPLLAQVAQVIKDAPRITVRIEGHTDNVGKLKTNLKVSQARAEAVRDFLVKQGVNPKQLIALGYGPTRPIASNATKAGKSLNRRVEFRIVDVEQK